MKLLTKTIPYHPVEVSVPVAHIPFVDTLHTRLEEARALVVTKQDYLKVARQVPGSTTSGTAMAKQTKEDEKTVKASDKAYALIQEALTLGCEPTTPNPQWYCGKVTKAQKRPRWFEDWEDLREDWPSRTQYDRLYVGEFLGAMPLDVLQRYALTRRLFGDEIRVYSPERGDFLFTPVKMVDPVLIGRIPFLGEWQYFEIARWDVSSDLATMFNRVK